MIRKKTNTILFITGNGCVEPFPFYDNWTNLKNSFTATSYTNTLSHMRHLLLNNLIGKCYILHT